MNGLVFIGGIRDLDKMSELCQITLNEDRYPICPNLMYEAFDGNHKSYPDRKGQILSDCLDEVKRCDQAVFYIKSSLDVVDSVLIDSEIRAALESKTVVYLYNGEKFLRISNPKFEAFWFKGKTFIQLLDAFDSKNRYSDLWEYYMK